MYAWRRFRALGEWAPEGQAALSALGKLLNDDDSEVRLAAAFALGEIGPKAKIAVPALTALLKDDDDSMRAAAAYASWFISSPTQRPFRHCPGITA